MKSVVWKNSSPLMIPRNAVPLTSRRQQLKARRFRRVFACTSCQTASLFCIIPIE